MSVLKQNALAEREALISIVLTVFYFLWWYFSAYGFVPSDIYQLPPLYLGLPLWFLLSCILGPILFIILTLLIVKYVFKDIEFDQQ